jgi:hypothetical protein
MRSRVGAHQALFDKIDHIYSVCQTLTPSTDGAYVIAELCKYSCILASAAIDVCLEDCLVEYCEGSNDARIIAFAKDRLGRARNPTIGIICNVLDAFDSDWKDRLEKFSDQKVRSDIGSIVSNRNEIAHGRNSQISFGRLMPWVKTAKVLCAELERTVFP